MNDNIVKKSGRGVPKRYMLVAWILILSAVAFMDRTNISIAGVSLGRDFGVDNAHLGWIFSAFLLGYAAFQVPGGILARRLGSRRVIAIGVIWSGVFTALTASVPTGIRYALFLLVVIRFSLAAGEALTYPAANQFVERWFPVQERGKANGIIFSGVGLGSGLTPPIMTIIMLRYGWRASFWFSAVVVLLAGSIWYLISRDTPEEHPWVRSGELAVIVQGRGDNDGRMGLDAAAAARAADLKLTVPWSRILRSKEVIALTGSYFTFGYVAWIFFSWFYIYLVQVRGLNLKTSAVYSMFPFIAMTLGSLSGGVASDWLSRRVSARAGRCFLPAFALAFTAILLCVGAKAHRASTATLVLACGAGVLYLSQSSFWSVTADFAGRHSGVVSGTMNTGCQVGGAVTASLTPMIASHFGWEASFMAATVLATLGAIAWLVVNPGARLESVVAQLAAARKPQASGGAASMKSALLLALMVFGTVGAYGRSAYPVRLDDPAAVYLTPADFHVQGDGKADDSPAIQAAIDKAQESHGEGIVFIPEGRYRITRTIYLWPGIRVIGYGVHRPVFVLTENTPGYSGNIAYMFFFAGARPHSGAVIRGGVPMLGFHMPPTPPGVVPPGHAVPDANPGTFYSAISNVDFEIGPGNAGAVAIRFHAAQHSFVSHIDFNIGSGFAGLHEVGNEAEDLHFHGGRFGIMARKPSPAWQFTLIDSSFDGQREAAIRENEAGLTLIHDEFKNVPTAVSIDPHYSDQLWISDTRFENIAGPAVLISNENSRMTEINFEAIVCSHTPVFVKFRESGREFRQAGEVYKVSVFSHGLSIDYPGALAALDTRYQASPLSSLPPATPSAIPPLPDPSAWVNVRTFGVKGDGRTDDTDALQQAITTHSVLYFPTGRYLVHDTLTLRPDSVLIGLHPSTTQFDLADGTAAFQGPGAPMPLLLAPSGGANIITGLGVFTGGLNSRAAGLLWRSGANSLVDDVRFLGGHGTNAPDGTRINPYNNTHTADPDLHRPWDAQYPSLWIDGGGGTFANIWTPDTFAQAGILISNTDIPGSVYELSSEHHKRAEIQLRNVSNWRLYAPQTEEESGESANASSLEIDRSSNITIANYHAYRVTHMEKPFPYAARVSASTGIHFRNVHVDANSSMSLCDGSGACRQLVRSNKVPFENAIVDPTLHAEVRDREFAWLDISDDQPRPAPQHLAGPAEKNHEPELLATGFFNISGAAINSAGDLYFVDAHFQRIYRWSPESRNAVVVRDAPLDPVNLVFDKSDDLVVVSSGGRQLTAYAFRPQNDETRLTLLRLEPAVDRPGMTAALPVDYWFNGDFADTLSAGQPYTYTSLQQMFEKSLGSRKAFQFISPDNSLFIPTDPPLVQGEPYFGTKWAPILEAYGLGKVDPGQTFYATNEAEQRTYRGTMNPDGSLAHIVPFVEQGGESLAQDASGNVYIAAGQVFVYSPMGKLLDVIAVPERPHDILFGGRDRQTLYMLSDHSLYAIRVGRGQQTSPAE